MLHSPRASFCSYVYSILKVLNSVIPIQKNDIIESFSELENTSRQINSDNLTEENPSLVLKITLTKFYFMAFCLHNLRIQKLWYSLRFQIDFLVEIQKEVKTL